MVPSREDTADPEVFDPLLNETFPVNPRPDTVINSFAIRWPASTLMTPGLQKPNLHLSNHIVQLGLWFIVPFDPQRNHDRPGKTSEHNLWMMVRHVYAQQLNGSTVDQLPSPYRWPSRWSSEVHILGDMKRDLQESKKWTRTLPPEFLTRGGEARSAEKTRSARKNLVAAQAARLTAAEARAREMIVEAAQTMPEEAVAALFDIEPSSVRKTIAIARRRLGLD